MSDIEYKLLLIDEMAAVMKQKLIEKEPNRPGWRNHPRIMLRDLRKWLDDEVEELMEAEPGQEMREAADVANLAMIWADVKRRGGP